MTYPLHQPIRISTGERFGKPVVRDGTHVDTKGDRADIPIDDQRQIYNSATHTAEDTEAAQPWPFDAANTKWVISRMLTPKAQVEIDAHAEAQKGARASSLSARDLITVLTAIVNEERTNRAVPVPEITEAQFISYVRTKLGI